MSLCVYIQFNILIPIPAIYEVLGIRDRLQIRYEAKPHSKNQDRLQSGRRSKSLVTELTRPLMLHYIWDIFP